MAILLAMLASPVLGETCPPAADHSVRLAEVLAEVRAAISEREARVISSQLWELWTDAPDARAQALLDEGMRRRATYDLIGARDILAELVAYCPDFAEGYNQRAFANYLLQDFQAALVDLERTLEIIPNHVGALAGKGLTLIGLGRDDEAQEALRAAVALNPWLSERALLTDDPGFEL